MIPSRSAVGLGALDVFFEGHNDVHFYVEDSGQENTYKALLERLFPRIRVTQIFPLGGKPNLIQHARDNVSRRALRKPQVYITDKDFDDILGKTVLLPGLFYLRKYCIENYLLDEKAVTHFVIEMSPKLCLDEVRRKLRFDHLLRRLVKDCEHLFRLFIIVQRHSLGLANARLPPERFCSDSQRDAIDKAKVAKYANDVANALVANGAASNKSTLREMLKSAFPPNVPADTNVSGKFLVKLLLHHLRMESYVGNAADDVMLFSLARNTNGIALRELGRRIRKYLRSLPRA